MNKDIEAAIRNALARGNKIEDVKRSLINAGYSKKEVEDTSTQLGQGATSIIYPTSTTYPSTRTIEKNVPVKQNVPSSSIINSTNEPPKPFSTSQMISGNPTQNQPVPFPSKDNRQGGGNIPQPNQSQRQPIKRDFAALNIAPRQGSFDNMPPAPRPTSLPIPPQLYQSNPLPRGEVFPEGIRAMPKSSNLVILITLLLILLSTVILGVIFREQVISYLDDLLSATS